MRLWCVNLLPYLPDLQIRGLWRELNSIYKKQDKHLLINYNYNYPKENLFNYSIKVIDEMNKRQLKIKDYTKFNKYFQMINKDNITQDAIIFKEQDSQQLLCDFTNLFEKYRRGQKGFTDEVYNK